MKENLLLKIKVYKYMTSISKNVCIDKLDDIVNKYNSTYHRTNLLMQNQKHTLTLVEKLMIKILNLKLVILLEYQNIKTFLQKITFQIVLKKFLLLKMLKTLCREHMLLEILTDMKLLERFKKKSCKKQTKKSRKSKKRKNDKLYVKWKGYSNSLNSWIDKKDII